MPRINTNIQIDIYKYLYIYIFILNIYKQIYKKNNTSINNNKLQTSTDTD